MCVQGRPSVRLRFGQHKGKPIEAVLFTVNGITKLAWLVIDVTHLVDLDDVVGSIERGVRGTRVAFHWKRAGHGGSLPASFVRGRGETYQPNAPVTIVSNTFSLSTHDL